MPEPTAAVAAVRPLAWLWSRRNRRSRERWANKQRFLDETAEPVTMVKDFLRRATPLAASMESEPGEITTRLAALDGEWSALRLRLVKRTDRHPSDDVQRSGEALAEVVDRLLMSLSYMGNPITDPKEKAAAVKSTMRLQDEAKAQADGLLQKIRSY